MPDVASSVSGRRRRPGSEIWRGVLYGYCALICVYLIAPMFVILPLSFGSAPYLTFPPTGFSLQWYRAYFESEQWRNATVLSVQIALAVTVLATVLGTLAALGLSRSEFRFKRVLNAFLVSPLVVPVIIMAIAIYHLYARMQLIGTPFGVVLAHTVLALPFVIVTVSAGLTGLDRNLELAARTLGASATQTFLRVTLPLIAGPIVAGALFAFITSFDEVVIAIFIGGTSAITLPKQMWDGVRNELSPTITAVASVMILVSVLLLALVSLVMHRVERLRNGVARKGRE
ncbi:MAG: ABC transporter permease [Lautropia sp.]